MSNWVKLHPEQFAEQLSAFRGCKSPEKSIGEWACGLSAGIAGAMLRIGASQAESEGHAYGASLLKASKEDKNIISERQRAKVQVRWNMRTAVDDESIPRYETGINENDTNGLPREEKRGEEIELTLSSKDARRVVEIWNEAVVGTGLPASSVNPKTEALIATRIKEPGWMDAFGRAVKFMAGDRFYQGAGSQGWVASLNWLLKPGNTQEIAEKAAAAPVTPEKKTARQERIDAKLKAIKEAETWLAFVSKRDGKNSPLAVDERTKISQLKIEFQQLER